MSEQVTLDQMIESVEKLGSFVTDATWDCAEAWKTEMDRAIRAGVDPYGNPWPLRKDTGEKALQHADDNLRVAPVGNVLIARITGPTARHHLGRGRGGIPRAILPEKGLPKGTINAIRDQVMRRYSEAF